MSPALGENSRPLNSWRPIFALRLSPHGLIASQIQQALALENLLRNVNETGRFTSDLPSDRLFTRRNAPSDTRCRFLFYLATIGDTRQSPQGVAACNYSPFGCRVSQVAVPLFFNIWQIL